MSDTWYSSSSTLTTTPPARSSPALYPPASALGLGLGRRSQLSKETTRLTCGAPLGVPPDLLAAQLEVGGDGEKERYRVPCLPTPLESSAPEPGCSAQRTGTRSTGCGALVHARASPTSGRTWYAPGEGSGATVIPLGDEYFTVAQKKILGGGPRVDVCGCVTNGVGCAVCGNTLGLLKTACNSHADCFSGLPRVHYTLLSDAVSPPLARRRKHTPSHSPSPHVLDIVDAITRRSREPSPPRMQRQARGFGFSRMNHSTASAAHSPTMPPLEVITDSDDENRYGRLHTGHGLAPGFGYDTSDYTSTHGRARTTPVDRVLHYSPPLSDAAEAAGGIYADASADMLVFRPAGSGYYPRIPVGMSSSSSSASAWSTPSSIATPISISIPASPSSVSRAHSTPPGTTIPRSEELPMSERDLSAAALRYRQPSSHPMRSGLSAPAGASRMVRSAER
ncbi:unnamed protein product [Mycena citricolor]|uniref:Uncharacterized protein n=1 Tax=Mycena citricolor TaxID=2018698 RepID=A0AAD2K6R1_9AGAR|nr:unnamed protein product [Mycena citricolor]CAK5282161.1 unnamed protein product [Mycena citricolor]